jgi:hypothetical protein
VNPAFSNCKNCGGILPLDTAGIEGAGPKPGMAPRLLPRKYVIRTKYTGNVMTIIGMVFTIPFIWSVIFPIIGVFLWRRGIQEANEELIPLRNGAVALGEIEKLEIDRSKHINGKSPWEITFLFDIGGRKHRGRVGNIFDDIDLQKHAGDKVWVVYMPENPELSSIWPPLK